MACWVAYACLDYPILAEGTGRVGSARAPEAAPRGRWSERLTRTGSAPRFSVRLLAEQTESTRVNVEEYEFVVFIKERDDSRQWLAKIDAARSLLWTE